MRPGFEAVVFDMDGVLADTEPLHAQAWVELLREFALDLEPRWFDRWIGVEDIDTAEDLVERFRLALAAPDLVERRRPIVERLMEESLRPFPGLVERIDALDDVPLAVATTARRRDAVRVLSLLGLLPRFPVLSTRDDVERPKPAPEVYLLAARRLGRAPEDCVAIEDSPAGVASARAGGFTVLAVRTTHPETKLAGADHVFDSTVDAVDWLLS